MIYFLKAIFDIISKIGWWSVIIIPALVVLIILGVEATGGFNPNTGNEFLEAIFNMISR